MIFIILQLDRLNHTQDKNRSEKGDSQKDTSQKVWTTSSENQVLTPSEPERLAERKDEIAKIEGEDALTAQPDDGKSCSHSQCPDN